MRVTEIFHSVQGESSYAGLPCVFVRLTGCPLRCTWCDTAYAFYEGTEMALPHVIDRVRVYSCPLVEITGGEPLHQPDVFPLIEQLCADGLTVLIETSGAFDIAPVDPRAHVILDIKCPGSGMTDRMYWPNVERLGSKDEAKFVIKHRKDYEWAVEVMNRYGLAERCTVLFGPVFSELEPSRLAQWILEDRVPVRFQLQLHKYIWDPNLRGV